jgi:DNA-binding SARP family transcriptional activator
MLAGVLWEKADPVQARKYLRQALWQVQSTLKDIIGKYADKLLTQEREWIQLNSCEYLLLDIALFEDAIRECQEVDGTSLSDLQRESLNRAVALYSGELLEGCYQDWCIYERERLQSQYLYALDKLVACCLANHLVDSGLNYASRILQCDPAEEQAHYHKMYLYWIAGHRTKALRQYQCCRKIIMQELGIQPSQQIKNLYDRIKTDEFHPSSNHEPTLPFDVSQLDIQSLRELSIYFQHLLIQLVAIEKQLKRNIYPVAQNDQH